MENNNHKQAIGLLRVSSDRQDVQRQRGDMRLLEQRFAIHLARTLELVGVSGTATLDNTQVQQVLADLRSPDISGIAVSALDRLLRPAKSYAQMGLLDAFVEHGKVIYSVREGFIDPGTDEGYDKCMMACGRAGAEWREIRRRCVDGRRAALSKGFLVGSKVPYGYTYVPKTPTDPGRRMIVNEKQAAVVRQIFAWRHVGVPPYEITARLNQSGILSGGYNGKPGGRWSRTVINHLLHNRAYIGEFHFAGHVLSCPPIVDEKVFIAVQRNFEEQRRKHTGRPSTKYLLRGMLWCGKCGRRCITSPNHGYPQYRCGHVQLAPYKKLCDVPGISVAHIEAAAWGALWTMLSDPAALGEQLRDYYAALGDPASDAVDELEAEWRRIESRIARGRHMLYEGTMPMAEGTRKIRDDEARLRDVEARLRAAGRVQRMPPAHVAEAALATVRGDDGEPDDYEGRRDVLEGLLELRMTYLEDQLVITGEVPMPQAAKAANTRGKNNYRRYIYAINSFASIPFKLTVSLAA